MLNIYHGSLSSQIQTQILYLLKESKNLNLWIKCEDIKLSKEGNSL